MCRQTDFIDRASWGVGEDWRASVIWCERPVLKMARDTFHAAATIDVAPAIQFFLFALLQQTVTARPLFEGLCKGSGPEHQFVMVSVEVN